MALNIRPLGEIRRKTVSAVLVFNRCRKFDGLFGLLSRPCWERHIAAEPSCVPDVKELAMTDRDRNLAVRVVLGLVMAIVSAFMLAGCPVTAPPPLEPRAAVSPADPWVPAAGTASVDRPARSPAPVRLPAAGNCR